MTDSIKKIETGFEMLRKPSWLVLTMGLAVIVGAFAGAGGASTSEEAAYQSKSEWKNRNFQVRAEKFQGGFQRN